MKNICQKSKSCSKTFFAQLLFHSKIPNNFLIFLMLEFKLLKLKGDLPVNSSQLIENGLLCFPPNPQLLEIYFLSSHSLKERLHVISYCCRHVI